MRKLWFILLLSCLAQQGKAQPDTLSGKLFSVRELQADLDTLYAWLTQTHPVLYQVTSKAKADLAWKQVREKITRPMNRIGFSKIISPLLTQYRDGHTGITPEFDMPEFVAYEKNGGKLLPLRVMIKGDRIWCAENYLANGVVMPGDEILAINEQPVKKIIADLLPVWPADDLVSNEVILSRLFSFTLWYYYGWGNHSKLELRKSNGKVKIGLPGLEVDSFMKKYFSVMKSWDLQLFPDSDLAIISSGAYNWSEEKTRRFLDSAFTIIKNNNIRHLAFDIRNNGGGNSSLGRLLLGYIHQQPSTSIRSKTFRSSPLLERLPAGHWLKKAYERAKKEWTATPDGYSQTFSDQEPSLPSNPDLYFRGRFFLLTSPRTFSSAHMTAMEVKCFGIGQIIGEPTGERLNLTGEITGIRLPNTLLEGIIPTASYTTACGDGKQVGVQPDIPVKVSPADLAAGRDPVMEKLRMICRQPFSE